MAPEKNGIARTYAAIWRSTWQPQLVLIALAVLIAAAAVLPLRYQKQIINEIVAGTTFDTLFSLGLLYVGIVVVIAALKFAQNFGASIVSEWSIRELRISLFEGQHINPGAADQNLPTSDLITMTSAEAEEVGKFVGASIATPLMQLGILVSVIAYVFYNQAHLGLILIVAVLPQALIAMWTQPAINRLVSERTREVRLGSRGMEEWSNAEAVQTDPRKNYRRAFQLRQRIFLLKGMTKTILNILNGLGVAGVLVAGGWLTLRGQTDVGTVVAAMSGFMQISQPWRELIAFYRNLSTTSVKYLLLVSALPGNRDVRLRLLN